MPGLDPHVRKRLERSLGDTPTGLRIHADAAADREARARDALAFTEGDDVFFRAGYFQPDDPSGLRLLAHEIAHVIQQGKGGREPSDAHEAEADLAADAVVAGRVAPQLSGAARGVQRTPGGGASRGRAPGEIAEEIQVLVDSISAVYQGTAVSGTQVHAFLNDALKIIQEGRLLTEVLIDPGGFVVGYGVGPAHVSTMRAAAEGALPPGYLRAVDAMIITEADPATVSGIRLGTISVHGKAIPVDHKFGGASVKAAEDAEIESLFGMRTLKASPGGDLPGAVTRTLEGEAAAGGTAASAGPRGAWTAPPVAALEGEETAAVASSGAIFPKVMGVATVLPLISWAHEYYETGGIVLGTVPGPNGPEEIGIGTHIVRRQVGTVPAGTQFLTVEVAQRILKEGDYFVNISFVWRGPPAELWRIVGGTAVYTGYHYDSDQDAYVRRVDGEVV